MGSSRGMAERDRDWTANGHFEGTYSGDLQRGDFGAPVDSGPERKDDAFHGMGGINGKLENGVLSGWLLVYVAPTETKEECPITFSWEVHFGVPAPSHVAGTPMAGDQPEGTP